SMTKSFTAATLLALRDEGRLHLDDPISAHVPEAAGAFELAADEREPTLRQLLTMSAGLVTDNPWGDRQEAMTREEFAATLRGAPAPGRARPRGVHRAAVAAPQSGGPARSSCKRRAREYGNAGSARIGKYVYACPVDNSAELYRLSTAWRTNLTAARCIILSL